MFLFLKINLLLQKNIKNPPVPSRVLFSCLNISKKVIKEQENIRNEQRKLREGYGRVREGWEGYKLNVFLFTKN